MASDFSIVSPVKTLYLDLSSAFSCIDHSFLKYSPLVLLQFCLLCFHWLCFIFVGSSSIQILTYRTVNFFFPLCHNLAHSPFLYIPMTLFDFLPRLLSLQSHISSSSFTSLNISNLTPAQWNSRSFSIFRFHPLLYSTLHRFCCSSQKPWFLPFNKCYWYSFQTLSWIGSFFIFTATTLVIVSLALAQIAIDLS